LGTHGVAPCCCQNAGTGGGRREVTKTCDKASLDIFWLKDESLEASDNLPDPDVIAQEIMEDLEAALD
jgi:hypothetical protein